MSRKQLASEIINFLQEGRPIIEGLQLQPNVIMFIGPTRAGKGTLIHYLNGRPLELFTDSDGEQKFEVRAGAELPGMEIGHSLNSCTRFPASYTSPGADFSYIDTPGFGDTGDINAATEDEIAARDIANAYFRKMLTDRASGFKIVLVVQEAHLTVGGTPIFVQALSDFTNFTQVIKSTNKQDLDINMMKDSISIVVTKTTVARNYIKVRLENFINQTRALDSMGKMKEVLSYIVANNHFASFAAPNSPNVGNSKEEIIRLTGMANNIFIPKRLAKFKALVSENHRARVMDALDELGVLTKSLANSIDVDISRLLKNAFVNGRGQVQAIKEACQTVNGYTASRLLKDFIHDVGLSLGLSDTTIRRYEEFNTLLTILEESLPGQEGGEYTPEKNWVQVLGLDVKLHTHIAVATDILREPQSNFTDGTLTFKGYHIKTSQIETKAQQHSNISNIAVYGLHTVELDKDLLMPGINVSIMVPNVTQLGHRVIDLSGKNALEHNNTNANDGKNGEDAPRVPPHTANVNRGGDGESGENGLNGAPGLVSGNLSIICAAMPDVEKLEVILNGGKGARGQDGGNGGHGGDGGSVVNEWPNFDKHLVNKHNVVEYLGKNYRGWRWEYNWIPNPTGTLSGGEGGCGGNVGLGGQGGNGGRAGQCNIIVSNSLVKDGINLQAKDGESGANGISGKPGRGGMSGHSMKAFWAYKGGNKGYDFYPNSLLRVRNSDVNNKQATNDTKPQPAKPTPEQNLILQLLDYRVLQGLEESKRANVVSDFFRDFRNCYENASLNFLKTTTDNLLAEADALEKYRALHGQDINFSLLYYSLFARLEKFMPTVSKIPQEHKVLSYLYANILGNIASIKALNDNLLIVNIETYARALLKGDINNLATMKATALKDRYKAQYAEQIQGKIKDAEEFLNILSEEVKIQQAAINAQTKNLEMEIAGSIEKGKGQIHDLEEKERQLKKAQGKKRVFGALNIATQIVGLAFPPFGEMAAGAVNAGIAMATAPSFPNAINFAESVLNMKSSMEEFKKPDKDEAYGFIKAFEIAQQAQSILKDTRKLLKPDARHVQSIRDLDDEIGKIDAYVEWLGEQLKTLPYEVKNYWQATFDGVEKLQGFLPDMSRAYLAFASGYEIKRYFEEIKQNILDMVGMFASSEGFHNIARKTNEAMDISINISTIIQEYREHMSFAGYLADLQTADVEKIDVGDKYREQVERLRINSQENIVSCEYYKVIGAFKQWVFPFAGKKFFLDIPNLEARDYETIKANLSKILYKVQKYKASVSEMDQAIHHRPFNTEHKPTFFTWSYTNYPVTINRLLEGKKVLLNSYIDKSRLDAIKLKRIDFEFHHPSKQGIFKKNAEQFQVTLKHSGVSYCKYGNDVYQMSNDKPMEIKFSFIKNKDGKPLYHNEVFEKLWNGDILLSPYTSWTVWLEPTPANGKTNYLSQNLKGVTEADKHDLSINLIGDGTYVDKRYGDTLHLYKYYRMAKNYLMSDNLDQESTSEEEVVNEEPWSKPRSKL